MKSRILCILPVLVLNACSDSAPKPSDITGPPASGGATNEFSAKVNGVTWTFPSALIRNGAVANVNGEFGASGSSASPTRTIALVIGRIPSVGTYPLGVGWPTNAGGSGTVIDGAKSWTTPNSGNAGTITVTSITATRIIGTFAFNAVSVLDSTDRISVTEGKFDVPRDGYSPPSAGDAGNFMRGALGTVTWNAGVASAQRTGTITVVSGLTDSYTVSLRLVDVTAPGTYTLNPQAHSVSVGRLGNVAAWGGLSGDQGTITITSVSTRRIAGRFSGTLAPLTALGTTVPLSVTNLEFDVRIGN